MKTLKILEEAIKAGYTNRDMQLVADNVNKLSFKDMLGDLSPSGGLSIDCVVPKGLFIWDKNKFISVPDCVFTDYKHNIQIAYYQL